jgi:hypothetical protein
MSSSPKNKRVKLDCSSLDEKFVNDIKAGLEKSRGRAPCKYDCVGQSCYQKNTAHAAKFSHPHNPNVCDIHKFKDETDNFLKNSYNIYKCHHNAFSLPWYTEVSANRGSPHRQLATMEYNRYDSLIFLMLANILLNLKEYLALYKKDFLLVLMQALEASDNTGLFKIEPESPLGKIFTKNAAPDPDTGKIDYRLGNTTIRGIIKKVASKSPSSSRKAGGRRSTRKRSSTSKRSSTRKRSSSKQAKQQQAKK